MNNMAPATSVGAALPLGVAAEKRLEQAELAFEAELMHGARISPSVFSFACGTTPLPSTVEVVAVLVVEAGRSLEPEAVRAVLRERLAGCYSLPNNGLMMEGSRASA